MEVQMEFYDTCALLNSYDSLQGKKFVISEISLKELEEIKSSRSKDEEAKFKARQVSKVLLENVENVDIVRFTEGVSKLWKINELADNNDGKILASVLWYSIHFKPDNVVFVCDDVCCRLNAVKLGIENRGSCNHIEDYRGYLEVTMTEDNMASFFQNPSENIYELNVNEYLIIDNLEKDNVYKWNGKIYEKSRDLFFCGIFDDPHRCRCKGD
jgi:predicted ribonuclease YlaK